MDFQVAFNIAVALAGFLGGWVLNSLKSAVDGLQRQDQQLADKVNAIEVLVAGQYVKRDDFEKFSDRIFTKLDALQRDQSSGIARIEDRLNGKADRHDSR